MRRESPPTRVLAIDPTSRGFGFAVLEGPGTLVDWGVRALGDRSSRATLGKLTDLLDHYRPDVLVVEDCTGRGSRRGQRARRLIEAARGLAQSRGVHTTQVTLAVVHELFDGQGSTGKHEIATSIADHFPPLTRRLPPKRKPWMSEAERMAIFDAIAFALAYYVLSAPVARQSA